MRSNLTMRTSSFSFYLLLVILVSPALAAQEVQDSAVPDIQVTGAPDFLAENILAHLSITNESCDLSQSRLQRFRRPVNQEVLRAANALGFYHLEHTLEFSRQDDCWTLLISVEPGPRITINDVQIDIVGDMTSDARRSFNTLVEENAPIRGDYLDHGEYERLKSILSAMAVEYGFYSSSFLTSEVAVDTVANSASIALTMDVGPQYLFGDITIENNTRLRNEFINRLVPVSPGDEFTSEAMLILNETLSDSSYFQTVSLNPAIRRAVNNQVPVAVTLTPRPRRSWSTGIGFTTDTGPRVRLAYEDRLVNSIGHQFDSDFSVSQVRSEVDFTYRIPLWQPSKEQLSLRGGLLNEDTDTYTSHRLSLEAAYDVKLNSGWQMSYFVNYQNDRYTVSDVEDDSTLVMPGVNISRTRSDDPVFPSRGWKFFAQIQGAGDAVFSDSSFLQGNVTYKRIETFGKMRILASAQAGTTAVDRITDLPASVRFFTGGDQSVRGYKYQTLGPLDSNLQVIGGKHLLTGSLETDFAITRNWRGALFIDHGNAFNDFAEMELKTSVGFGIRWLSPIGPLRLDFAHPVQDGGVRFHITMGPDL